MKNTHSHGWYWERSREVLLRSHIFTTRFLVLRPSVTLTLSDADFKHMNILGRSTAGLSPGFILKPSPLSPISHILLLQEEDRKGREANELRARNPQATSSSSRVNVRAKGER